MGAEKVNESLVKYLAGLLDADGSLSFTFKRWDGSYYLGITLKLDSSDAIDKKGLVATLPAVTGMGSVYRSGRTNQFVSWMVSKRADLEMLLPRLIKHMVIKARHWQWMLDVWRERRGQLISPADRDDLATQCKESRKTRSGPLQPKNHPTWAWLAGYLDGDGWYSRYATHVTGYKGRSYAQWTIKVGAVAHKNDAAVLAFLQNAFGGAIYPHGQSDNVMIWRRSLGYAHRSFALRFLPNLAKHSRLKRDKIEAIIHHHRQRLSVPGTKVQATV